MIRIYGCIVDQHDLRLVLLAGLICFFGAYTALSLFARAQSATNLTRHLWLAGTAIVSGNAIWSTHFVAMLAFQPGFAVGYDVILTIASAVIAVLLSGLAFFVARHGRTAPLGGAILGIAISTMHYIGMAALSAPAIQHWNAAYILTSVTIGVVLGALALSMAEKCQDILGRIATSLVLVLAICGMHFTGMTSLTLEPDPTMQVTKAVMAPEWLAIAIASVTMLMIGLSLTGTIVDQHLAYRNAKETARLKLYVTELEATKSALEVKTREVTLALEAAAAASQAKSQFLAAMSHELRTPLNAIIGFSEILSREMFGPIGDSRYRGYAENIVASGGHLLGLINDVLDFSKLEAGRFELQDDVVEIAKVVSETVRMIGQQAEQNGLRLLLDLAPDLPRIHADSRRLRQILLNLISNSIKFTPGNGEIKISAAFDGDDLVLAVADTGIGMAAEDIPTALSRFGQIDSRLSRKYDGTGLGLPLSKLLVELHGGTLTIESTVGSGTTVMIRFPRERMADLELPDGAAKPIQATA
jgi:signal transduction histidine kinase